MSRDFITKTYMITDEQIRTKTEGYEQITNLRNSKDHSYSEPGTLCIASISCFHVYDVAYRMR